MTETTDAASSGMPGIEELRNRYDTGVERALRRFNSVLHVAAGVTMVVLMLWTVGDIISRSLFATPFRGTVELTELAVVILVYLGLGRAENQDDQISVDLLFVHLGKRAQLWVRVVAGVVNLIVVAALTWRLFAFAAQLNSGGQTTGVLRIPLYPIAITGVVGCAAFLLATLSNLLLFVRALMKER